MKQRSAIMIALLLGGLAAAPSQAASTVTAKSRGAERTYSTFGKPSCTAWVKSIPSNASAAAAAIDSVARLSSISWLMGYVSGINVASTGPNLLQDMDGDTAIDWVDSYCVKHPADDVIGAIDAMLTRLGRKP